LSRQFLLPGVGLVNETGSRQYLLPGDGVWREQGVQYPSVAVAPTAASAVTTTVAPTLVWGSTSAAPSAATSVAATVDPTVLLGALSIAPTAAAVVAMTIRGVILTNGVPDRAAGGSGSIGVHTAIMLGL